MHVASRPIEPPVALIERPYTRNGERCYLRVLVFREGLLARPVVLLLGKILAHI